MTFRSRVGGTVAALAIVLLGLGAYKVYQSIWRQRQLHAAEEAITRRDFDLASVHLNHLLSVWPDDRTLCLMAARTARRRGDFATAQAHLNALPRPAASGDELENRLLLAQMGNLLEMDALIAAAAADPDGADTHLLLEAGLEGILNVGERIGSALDVVEPPPLLTRARAAADQWLAHAAGKADRVQGLVWRGRLLALLGQHAPCVSDLRAAVELDADHFQARWHLAQAIAQTDPQEAACHIEILQRSNPDNQQLRLVSATVRRNLGELESARALLDEVLARDPKMVGALLERGLVELDAQQPKQAEDWLRRAEEQDPQSAAVLHALSRTLRALGDAPAALEYQRRFERVEAERRQNGSQLVETMRGAAH